MPRDSDAPTTTAPLAVGFTGTRRGMTSAQRASLGKLLRRVGVLHHGDCVGADAEAHSIAQAAGVAIEVWPPIQDNARAFVRNPVIHEAQPYLDRNRSIVDATAELIACPHKYTEEFQGGSGTWFTVRYARKQGRRVLIIWPDGTVRGWR